MQSQAAKPKRKKPAEKGLAKSSRLVLCCRPVHVRSYKQYTLPKAAHVNEEADLNIEFSPRMSVRASLCLENRPDFYRYLAPPSCLAGQPHNPPMHNSSGAQPSDAQPSDANRRLNLRGTYFAQPSEARPSRNPCMTFVRKTLRCTMR